MASSTPFDGTNFLTGAPDVDQPHGNDYQEHQSTRKSMEFVNNKEHAVIANDPSAADGGGEHKNGSSVAYFASTDPTLRPDGATALADNDIDKGRMLNDPGDVSNAAGLKGWNGSSWINIGSPSGMLTQYAGSVAPSGWLLCNGATGLSTVTNPEYLGLFSVIGNTYGGASTTDFDLPDMRERVPVGVKSGGTFNSLGDTGGEETHDLITAEMPIHAHQVETFATGNVSTKIGTGTGTKLSQQATATSGGGDPHNNLQPYLVINYIIKI